MKIYFLRHGQTDTNYRGGWSTFGLTEQGKLEAEEAGRLIKDKNLSFDYIISSDLPRAKETAEIINKYLNKDIVYSEDWREYNNGILKNMSNEEADKNYPEYIFVNMNYNSQFPSGESPKEYYKRITTAFSNVLKENKAVLIVTHGGVIDIIYHLANNLKWSNKSKHKYQYDNCEFCEFDF